MEDETKNMNSLDTFMFGKNYLYQQPNEQNNHSFKNPTISSDATETDPVKELLDQVDMDKVVYYSDAFMKLYQRFKPLYEEIVPIISNVIKKSK